MLMFIDSESIWYLEMAGLGDLDPSRLAPSALNGTGRPSRHKVASRHVDSHLSPIATSKPAALYISSTNSKVLKYKQHNINTKIITYLTDEQIGVN